MASRVHRLTLFGQFVESLRMSITDTGGRRFKKSDLVFMITGQKDTSQASRYLRMFDENKPTFWYHKSTIARMIASAGQADGANGVIRRKARGGYEFIGSPNSAVSVRALEDSIQTLWEESDSAFVLREALERGAVTPESRFCSEMCTAYAQEYGIDDLHPCLAATCADRDGAELVRQTYQTMLVAVLLGPPATAMMLGRSSVTPRGLEGTYKKVMDGFSLIQLIEDEGGMLVPANDLGFEVGSRVTIGRDARDDIAYVPLRMPGVVSYVSGLHARICQMPGDKGWELHNLSTTNGTTVYHTLDGSLRFMAQENEVEPLSPGDEIWLAPLPPGTGTSPSYEMGVVLRFEHLYKYIAR